MKFEGVRKSNDGTDTTIFLFAMNAKEAELIAALTSKMKVLLPRTHDSQHCHHRLRNIRQEIGWALQKMGFRSPKDFTKEIYT